MNVFNKWDWYLKFNIKKNHWWQFDYIIQIHQEADWILLYSILKKGSNNSCGVEGVFYLKIYSKVPHKFLKIWSVLEL